MLRMGIGLARGADADPARPSDISLGGYVNTYQPAQDGRELRVVGNDEKPASESAVRLARRSETGANLFEIKPAATLR